MNCFTGNNVLTIAKENLQTLQTAILLDVAFFVVLFIFSLIGARKGAIRSIIGLLSTILAVVFAFVFASSMADVLEDWFGLQSGIAGGLEKVFARLKGFDLDISTAGIEEALKNATLPGFLVDGIAEAIADPDVPQGTTLARKAGEVASGYICRFLSWIVVFLAVKLAMRLLSGVLHKIAEKVPAVGATNVLLGVVIGFLKGLFIACAVFAVLSLFPSEKLVLFMDETYFVRFLFHENPILKLIAN